MRKHLSINSKSVFLHMCVRITLLSNVKTKQGIALNVQQYWWSSQSTSSLSQNQTFFSSFHIQLFFCGGYKKGPEKSIIMALNWTRLISTLHEKSQCAWDFHWPFTMISYRLSKGGHLMLLVESSSPGEAPDKCLCVYVYVHTHAVSVWKRSWFQL